MTLILKPTSAPSRTTPNIRGSVAASQKSLLDPLAADAFDAGPSRPPRGSRVPTAPPGQTPTGATADQQLGAFIGSNPTVRGALQAGATNNQKSQALNLIIGKAAALHPEFSQYDASALSAMVTNALQQGGAQALLKVGGPGGVTARDLFLSCRRALPSIQQLTAGKTADQAMDQFFHDPLIQSVVGQGTASLGLELDAINLAIDHHPQWTKVDAATVARFVAAAAERNGAPSFFNAQYLVSNCQQCLDDQLLGHVPLP